MSRNSHPCPASQVSSQLTGIFAIGAAGFVGGLMDARASAAYAREERASHVLYQQVEEASQTAREWAAYAERLIHENERLKAENARLRTVSAERQAMVDHLLGKRIAA